jgi:hypothetical protein
VPAVRVSDGAGAVIEDNDLSGNLGGAWSIEDGGEPSVRRARNIE